MPSKLHAAYFFHPALYKMIMSNDEVKGEAKQIEGYVREGVGKLTDNKAEQVKGWRANRGHGPRGDRESKEKAQEMRWFN